MIRAVREGQALAVTATSRRGLRGHYAPWIRQEPALFIVGMGIWIHGR